MRNATILGNALRPRFSQLLPAFFVALGVAAPLPALAQNQVPAQPQTITFESLAPGQVVDTVRADGGYGPIHIFGSNLTNTPEANAAVLFDSHCAGGCTGSDPDLGSPNAKFGGPGQGFEGGRAPYANTSALGNVLIVHEYPREIEAMGNVFGVSDPDDEGGATRIEVTFPRPVTLFSFQAIDREYNEFQNVSLFDGEGLLLGEFTTPNTGNNGLATVLTGAEGMGTAGVVRMVMEHQGSGGLDNIVFAPTPEAPVGCVLPLSYWKKNPDKWPVRQLTLGGVTYGKRAMLDIMVKNPNGDKSILLAEQLITAHLNIASGADGTEILSTIAAADQWLSAIGGIGHNQRKWNQGEWIKNMLTSFNAGDLVPGTCPMETKKGDKSKKHEAAPSGQDVPMDVAQLPAGFVLEGNYPNPFNPTTAIRFDLPEAAHVRLSVFDMLGREVEVLVDGTLEAGQHAATFDGADLPSGSYLYRLDTPAGSFTRLMTFLK